MTLVFKCSWSSSNLSLTNTWFSLCFFNPLKTSTKPSTNNLGYTCAQRNLACQQPLTLTLPSIFSCSCFPLYFLPSFFTPSTLVTSLVGFLYNFLLTGSLNWKQHWSRSTVKEPSESRSFCILGSFQLVAVRGCSRIYLLPFFLWSSHTWIPKSIRTLASIILLFFSSGSPLSRLSPVPLHRIYVLTFTWLSEMGAFFHIWQFGCTFWRLSSLRPALKQEWQWTSSEAQAYFMDLPGFTCFCFGKACKGTGINLTSWFAADFGQDFYTINQAAIS